METSNIRVARQSQVEDLQKLLICWKFQLICLKIIKPRGLPSSTDLDWTVSLTSALLHCISLLLNALYTNHKFSLEFRYIHWNSIHIWIHNRHLNYQSYEYTNSILWIQIIEFWPWFSVGAWQKILNLYSYWNAYLFDFEYFQEFPTDSLHCSRDQPPLCQALANTRQYTFNRLGMNYQLTPPLSALCSLTLTTNPSGWNWALPSLGASVSWLGRALGTLKYNWQLGCCRYTEVFGIS